MKYTKVDCFKDLVINPNLLLTEEPDVNIDTLAMQELNAKIFDIPIIFTVEYEGKKVDFRLGKIVDTEMYFKPRNGDMEKCWVYEALSPDEDVRIGYFLTPDNRFFTDDGKARIIGQFIPDINDGGDKDDYTRWNNYKRST